MDLKKTLEITEKRMEASDVMAQLKTYGWWVKDMNFKFLDISDEASKILYGEPGRHCIKKTDLEMCKEAGIEVSEDMFNKVCRGSDLYIFNNAKDGKYKDTMFIELLTSIDGNKHIWQTTKGIVPNKENEGRYYRGEAVFLDKIFGYEKALKVLNSHGLEKINNNLYVYK